MTLPHVHGGVAADDPRNAGPIARFRPGLVTRDSARARLAPYCRRKGEAALEARVEALMARIAAGPVRADPPLSQPLEAVEDPWFGLGVHPDIIEEMWRLDAMLPERCRWVFWGRPALVHPRSGVVFAVGYGTIGFAMRLPPAILVAARPEEAAASVAGAPGQTFDVSAAGPEWRFIRARAPKAAWARAAFDFAA